MSLASTVKGAISMLKGGYKSAATSRMLGKTASPYAMPKGRSKGAKKTPKTAKPSKSPKTTKAPKATKPLGLRAKARGASYSPSRESGVPKRPGRAPKSASAKTSPSRFPMKNSFPVSNSGKFSSKAPKQPKAAKTPKTPKADKKVSTATKGALKQGIKQHSTKMLFHMKQADRLKAKGAHEAGHAQHGAYMGHLKNIQTHKTGMGKKSRALINHVASSGGKRRPVAGGMSAAISRMRY